jgi:hypothetical protein
LGEGVSGIGGEGLGSPRHPGPSIRINFLTFDRLEFYHLKIQINIVFKALGELEYLVEGIY